MPDPSDYEPVYTDADSDAEDYPMVAYPPYIDRHCQSGSCGSEFDAF